MARLINPVVALLVALCSTQAFAYPTPVDFSGKLLRWNIDQNSPPIRVRIVSDDATEMAFYEELVADAVSLWSSVPASYIRLEVVSLEDHAQISVNIKGRLSGARFSSGYAIFDESDEDGPLHCDIHVADNGSTVAFAKTLLHELGHCLGLGHSLIPQAIMSYNLAANRYALDTDDRAAVARLYPADGSSPALPPGCAIGAARLSHRAHWPIVFLWLVPVAFIFLGRKQGCERNRRLV